MDLAIGPVLAVQACGHSWAKVSSYPKAPRSTAMPTAAEVNVFEQE